MTERRSATGPVTYSVQSEWVSLGREVRREKEWTYQDPGWELLRPRLLLYTSPLRPALQ